MQPPPFTVTLVTEGSVDCDLTIKGAYVGFCFRSWSIARSTPREPTCTLRSVAPIKRAGVVKDRLHICWVL